MSTAVIFNPASKPDLAPYLATRDTPVAQLEGRSPFATLSAKETHYAAAIGQACWDGYKITLIQTSKEAPVLFELLRLVFSAGSAALRSAALASGATEEQIDLFIVYAAHIFENCGPYRSFGDSKILPAIPSDVFERIVFASPALKGSSALALAKDLFSAIAKDIYDDSPRSLQLGLGPTSGVSTYYSSNFTEEDGALIARFVKSKALLQPYNTRVFKATDGSFVIRLAASITHNEPAGAGNGKGFISGTAYDSKEHLLLGEHEFEGKKISIVRGDYAPLMARVCGHLAAAQSHAANEHQVAMLSKYIDSFRTGSQEAFMDGSRDWVKDKGPAVESYISFVESYRDPLGVRGEWEGFVAVVNKEESAKYGQLVGEAEALLPLLPWEKAFERDEFVRPDFTSLEVLAWGGSGLPGGINIPNFAEVREGPGGGFKNVSLANVLAARDFKDRISFLGDADQELYKRCAGPSFSIQVGLHELLGHGSGKCFTVDADGKKNFQPEAVQSALGSSAAKNCYGPGESWDTVFGGIASTMEECRAEAVGIYLCTEERVHRIFGHNDAKAADDLVYCNWLNMARAGLLALQYYNPTTKTWGQAHMQARYVLLRVMLDAGEGFVTIPGLDSVLAAGVEGAAKCVEGEGGVFVKMDRSKILSVGRPAIGKFLRQLQLYKSTANFAEGSAAYLNLSSVPSEWLALRSLVIAKRKPRQMLVQPVIEPFGSEMRFEGCPTDVTLGKEQRDWQLRTFQATPAGLCDSFAHRYPSIDSDLLALWKADRPHHELA